MNNLAYNVRGVELAAKEGTLHGLQMRAQHIEDGQPPLTIEAAGDLARDQAGYLARPILLAELYVAAWVAAYFYDDPSKIDRELAAIAEQNAQDERRERQGWYEGLHESDVEADHA